ncbi:phosphoribosyltransferase [Chloroflexota bacterium]
MMHFSRPQPIFENRQDAGRQLASKLKMYQAQSVAVLAIPNGGVPVALEVAIILKADLDLIICRKIPLPLTPEGGFGACADDGTVILNEEIVKRIGLSRHQIEHEARRVRIEIKRRSLLYKGDQPLVKINGRTTIIIDDGMASGITMIAAVESVRHRQPGEVVVAVPCAAAMAVRKLEKVADRVITCSSDLVPKFVVANYYRYWYDLSDEDVLHNLKTWRKWKFNDNVKLPPSDYK